MQCSADWPLVFPTLSSLLPPPVLIFTSGGVRIGQSLKYAIAIASMRSRSPLHLPPPTRTHARAITAILHGATYSAAAKALLTRECSFYLLMNLSNARLRRMILRALDLL
jgi:hypothetical protein